MNINIQKVLNRGVSIWLDSLSREMIKKGQLSKLVELAGVSGVTTNPSIFREAILEHDAGYDLEEFIVNKVMDPNLVLEKLTTDDVKMACDILKPVYEATNGLNGRVSIEVDPRLAHDTPGTIAAAEKLATMVGRDNVLIKIPATKEGLPAITAVLAKGISVNVTLIFSLERYSEVRNAFVAGLTQARAAGLDISRIYSVASFFVSRIDKVVDPLLEANGSEEARKLVGNVAATNALLAFLNHGNYYESNQEWAALEKAGAKRQRLLWASTSVKDRRKPTFYVDSLALANTINTMPPNTLLALMDETHESFYPNSLGETILREKLNALEKLGINFEAVTSKLEEDGVASFISAWEDVLDALSNKLQHAARNL